MPITYWYRVMVIGKKKKVLYCGPNFAYARQLYFESKANDGPKQETKIDKIKFGKT